MNCIPPNISCLRPRRVPRYKKRVIGNRNMQFSPIKCDSPKSTNGSCQNLTGSERRIKDSTADIHNAIDKWDSLSLTGMNLTQQIANIKLSAIYGKAENEDNVACDVTLPPELEDLCNNLLGTFNKMKRQVEKLAKAVTTLEGVVKLESHMKEDDRNTPLFLTWPTSRFAVTAEKLYAMYKQECDMREQIVENIAHCKDRQTMMFYTACWLHSPYIDTNKVELLHSLLVETGHLKQ